MKAEKIVLSIVGLFIGLLVAGGGFFLYKFLSTSPTTNNDKVISKSVPTPTGMKTDDLKIDSPVDESVVSNRSVTVSGKTIPNATIIVSSESSDAVGKATSGGDFSMTVTIPVDTSILRITAVLPDGQTRTITETITYSTESF
jgi:hypothetical protein